MSEERSAAAATGVSPLTAQAVPAELPANSIGLFGTTASTLANIAPALSVYLTIPAIVVTMGSMAPWAFVIAAVAILATGNSLIEFARRMPTAGGFVSYLTRAAPAGRPGIFVGSMTFYLTLLIPPISVGSVLVFLGSWTVGYAGWPAGTWIWVALVAMAAGVPFLLRGTGLSVKAAFLLYLTEGVALLILSAVVLVSAHGAIGVPLHAVGGSPGGFAGIGGLTFALAVFAYVGWENSAPMGEESRDPHRTIPRTVVLSIVVSMAILFIAAWALVAGFAGWKGAAAGMRALTASTANPFLVLASHYAPWLHLIMFLIGITSCLSCFLAAGLPATRYIFHGARAGLLPRPLAGVSGRTGVPYPAVIVYVALMAAVTVVLDLIMHDAITIFTDEAGISTVPLLLIYAGTCVLLPFFVWRVDRAHFSLLRHLIYPLAGLLVVGYGIWESVKPGQAPPANHYWIFILLFLAVAAAGAVAALRSGGPSPAALSQGITDE